MADHNIKYREQFKIRASEIDFEQKASLPAICNLLQEVAGNHARKLEFDITDLQQDELTWVLRRLTVEMDRFPDWRETITIETWASGGDGLRAYRDFQIIGEKGNTIGRSLSYWLIMNIKSRRLSRIPKDILRIAPKNADHVLPVNKIDFPELIKIDHSRQYQVRETDLDLNRHVNNVCYIEWALSTLPEGISTSKFDITFLAEAVLGDTVVVETGKNRFDAATFLHQLIKKDDEKVLAKAISFIN